MEHNVVVTKLLKTIEMLEMAGIDHKKALNLAKVDTSHRLKMQGYNTVQSDEIVDKALKEIGRYHA